MALIEDKNEERKETKEETLQLLFKKKNLWSSRSRNNKIPVPIFLATIIICNNEEKQAKKKKKFL